MVTLDDIRLILAYFYLRSRRRYCRHEIAWRPRVPARFLWLARRILGDVPANEILLRLVTLGRRKAHG
jgi:hypothetical protein